MIYKDTLALFDELVAGGTPEVQARVQARQLGAVGNALEEFQKNLHTLENTLNGSMHTLENTLNDSLDSRDKTLNNSIYRLSDTLIKIEKDLFWIRVVGGGMVAAFIGIWFK